MEVQKQVQRRELVELHLPQGEAAGSQPQKMPAGTWCPQNIHGDPGGAQGSLGQGVLCEDSVGKEVKPLCQKFLCGNGGKMDE